MDTKLTYFVSYSYEDTKNRTRISNTNVTVGSLIEKAIPAVEKKIEDSLNYKNVKIINWILCST